jgi:tRNA 2-thiouridine synthesizing protein A
VYNYKSSLAQPLQRVPTMTEIQEDRLLDCSGLSCPLPILKTKKTMDGMVGGEVLKMISTDPGSLNDVNAWTSRTSNPLLDATEDDGDYIFFIRKK